ncbi:MAG TPA: hypothetical protein VGV88_09225 [Candidatus Dormibacteraeota bacterium]|nr:hypothetical protein [Candidatus Dormibacteraeota bacterium]
MSRTSDSDPSFVLAVEHLDSARDHLMTAACNLKGFAFPDYVGLPEAALIDEVSDLAFRASLLADLVAGFIAAAPSDGIPPSADS